MPGAPGGKQGDWMLKPKELSRITPPISSLTQNYTVFILTDAVKKLRWTWEDI